EVSGVLVFQRNWRFAGADRRGQAGTNEDRSGFRSGDKIFGAQGCEHSGNYRNGLAGENTTGSGGGGTKVEDGEGVRQGRGAAQKVCERDVGAGWSGSEDGDVIGGSGFGGRNTLHGNDGRRSSGYGRECFRGHAHQRDWRKSYAKAGIGCGDGGEVQQDLR